MHTKIFDGKRERVFKELSGEKAGCISLGCSRCRCEK